MTRYPAETFREKLEALAAIADGSAKTASPAMRKALRDYSEYSAKQTTHPARRAERQRMLLEILDRV